MYVITGGGTGIGQALAVELASKQKTVLIIGRREEKLKKTSALSENIHYCVADVSTSVGREKVQAAVKDRVLAGLIHSAGSIEPLEKINKISPDAWEKQFHINLFAPFRLTQLLLNQLRGGRVLHIGSGAAHFPLVGWSAYCASKAALAMLTQCQQLEIADPVFASVMPGITATDMTAFIRQSAEAMSPEQHRFHQTLYEQNRLIQPQAVGQFLAWLLLEVDCQTYAAKEWDIYDTSHHASWIKEGAMIPPLS